MRKISVFDKTIVLITYFRIKFGKCEQCTRVSEPICRKNKGAEGDFQQGEADYSRATEGSLLYYSKSNLILLLLQYI